MLVMSSKATWEHSHEEEFCDEQINSILHEAEAGVSARQLFCKNAISDSTFYTSLEKYGGMELLEVKRLKSLDEENAGIKKLLAEAILDKEALQVAPGRKSDYRPEPRSRESYLCDNGFI